MFGQVAFIVRGLADRIPEHETAVQNEVIGCEGEQIPDQVVQIVPDDGGIRSEVE